MSSNTKFYSLTKIFLTTTFLVGTALPTIAHNLDNDQNKKVISISDHQEILASPCYKNPTLPQCRPSE